MRINYYKDLFERFVVLLVYLNTYDLFMTYLFVSNGVCTEANPFMNKLIVELGLVWGFVLYKSLCSVMFTMLLKLNEDHLGSCLMFMVIPLAAYSTIAVYHSCILLTVKYYSN